MEKLRKCVECNIAKPVSGYYNGKVWSHFVCKECQKENTHTFTVFERESRRTKEKALPVDLNGKQWVLVIERFGGGCALTGSGTFAVEHWLPVHIGHGGLTYGNCYPLESRLNSSKGERNPFEWFQANKERLNLSEDKWNELVFYLAMQNDLTFEEFVEFTNWCFANPRTVEECNADPRPSVEIWREYKKEEQQ